MSYINYPVKNHLPLSTLKITFTFNKKATRHKPKPTTAKPFKNYTYTHENTKEYKFNATKIKTAQKPHLSFNLTTIKSFYDRELVAEKTRRQYEK